VAEGEEGEEGGENVFGDGGGGVVRLVLEEGREGRREGGKEEGEYG